MEDEECVDANVQLRGDVRNTDLHVERFVSLSLTLTVKRVVTPSLGGVFFVGQEKVRIVTFREKRFLSDGGVWGCGRRRWPRQVGRLATIVGSYYCAPPCSASHVPRLPVVCVCELELPLFSP